MYSDRMSEKIQEIMDEDRFFRISMYILLIGVLAAFYMLFTTLMHYYLGTELPDQSEFFQQSSETYGSNGPPL